LLADGYSEVPAGKLAAVVTCLEMRAKPVLRPEPADARGARTPWTLERVAATEARRYLELFERVGADWLWFSRLSMPLSAVAAMLGDPDVEVRSLRVDGRDEGLLELDFREDGVCELALFGVTGQLQGAGAGRFLMNRAIELAWRRGIGRFWVHTCTLDHPAALGFYLRSGFQAYARRVEIADDPRVSGLLPRTAAPQIPIVDMRLPPHQEMMLR
jgi:GNAT superfamily N-acetyltransferase